MSKDKVVIGCLGTSLALMVSVAGVFISMFQGCAGVFVGVGLDALDGQGHDDNIGGALDASERTFYTSLVIAGLIIAGVAWYLWPKRKG
jgi:hypothetical protein